MQALLKGHHMHTVTASELADLIRKAQDAVATLQDHVEANRAKHAEAKSEKDKADSALSTLNERAARLRAELDSARSLEAEQEKANRHAEKCAAEHIKLLEDKKRLEEEAAASDLKSRLASAQSALKEAQEHAVNERDAAREMVNRIDSLVNNLTDLVRRATGLAERAGIDSHGNAIAAAAAGDKRRAGGAGAGAGSGGHKRRRGVDGGGGDVSISIDLDDEDEDEEVQVEGEEEEEESTDPVAAMTSQQARLQSLQSEAESLEKAQAEARVQRDTAVVSRTVFSHVRSMLACREAIARIRREMEELSSEIANQEAAHQLGDGKTPQEMYADTAKTLHVLERDIAEQKGRLVGANDAVHRVKEELKEPDIANAGKRHHEALVACEWWAREGSRSPVGCSIDVSSLLSPHSNYFALSCPRFYLCVGCSGPPGDGG